MSAEDRLSWRDVRDEIHESILSGRYAPGDRLPRDADIAETLNCARSTVQRAMQDLSDSGVIERRRKGGTRVRRDPVTRAVFEIPVIRREVEERGGRYGYRLVRVGETVPPPGVLAELEVGEPRPMLRIEALHLSDRRPYMLEDRWVDLATVPEIRGVDLRVQSANEWLLANRPYNRCDLRLRAVAADTEIAVLLDCLPGAACFVVERTTWIEAAPITTVRATAAPGYELLSRG